MVVRTEWRISGRWLLKDQTEHICEGARRVCHHFEKRPHSVLTLHEDAQRLLLGHLDALLLPPLSEKFQSFCIVILPISWAHHGIKCWVLFDMFQAGSSKICLV